MILVSQSFDDVFITFLGIFLLNIMNIVDLNYNNLTQIAITDIYVPIKCVLIKHFSITYCYFIYLLK
jgi:hypothetical protein